MPDVMNKSDQTRKPGEKELDELAALLKVLAEPNRLLILDRIMSGYRCNCNLGESLSLAPNLVSHHLSVLTESGLVDARRSEHDGRWMIYSINERKLEALNKIFSVFFDRTRIQHTINGCGKRK